MSPTQEVIGQFGTNGSYFRPGLPLIVGASLVVLTGCDATSSETGFSVRDSVGIAVVENFGQAWGPSDAWTLADSPSLSIGRREGSHEYLFDQITGAGRLGDGRIFVADRGSGQIRIYGADGSFLTSAGRRGDGPGEFTALSRVGLSAGDTIFAFDSWHRRLSIITPDGEFARSITPAPEVDGRLITAVWLPSGKLLGAVHSWPEGPSQPADQSRLGKLTFTIHDEAGRQERVLAEGLGDEAILIPVGERLTFRIPLFGYRATALAAPNGLYVGTSRDFEIEFYDYDAGLRAIWRLVTFDPTLSEEEIQETSIRLINQAIPDVDPLEYLQRNELPVAGQRPPYSRMILDPLGHLWVAEWAPSTLDARKWRVFAGESGVYLGTVEMPPGFRLLSVGESEVLGRYRDAWGVEYIWRLELDRRH